MSEKYIPLYRKYRPQTLSEVVGQGHIKKALTNAINLNKISHAYLFTGPRGTGKTSTARILAKSLNCVEGPTVNPCGKCPSCVDITNSTPVDVIEIDAASNRKVEDAQNILEKIQYAPVNGKFKIYIIDEVHMLSNTAFNALLKTLEEPPENVIFILATTEPQKVLDTIKSRCQRFDFRRITTVDIAEHLKKIAKKEKIKIEDDAIATIAKSAAGGMRDSLALLDQVSVLDNDKAITSDDVNMLLGRLSFEVLFNLTEKIISSDPQSAVENLNEIYNAGNEPTQILTNLLNYFKNLLIVKNCSKKELLEDLTQCNENQIKKLKTQADKLETQQIVFLTERTAFYVKEVKTANNQHLWLEVGIIDLANLTENTALINLQERLSRLEQGGQISDHPISPRAYHTKPAPVKIETEEPVKQVFEAPKPAKAPEKKVAPVVSEDEKSVKKSSSDEKPKSEPKEEKAEDFSPMPKAQPSAAQGSNELIEYWKQFIANISSPPTVALLTDYAKPVEFTPEKVVIACDKEFSLKALSTDMKKKMLTEAAKKIFNVSDINLTVRLSQPNDVSFGSFSPAQTPTEKKNPITPTKKQTPKPEDEAPDEIDPEIEEEIDAKMKKKKLEDKFMSDQVNMVMQLFDGKYID
jgi:DNA polymerase-3 subunit gamma/tau